MAKKEDLKGLLEQYFPNNDTGEITEPKIREFLGKVIDLIPEIAGDRKSTRLNSSHP